jgi:hypothetical protein
MIRVIRAPKIRVLQAAEIGFAGGESVRVMAMNVFRGRAPVAVAVAVAVASLVCSRVGVAQADFVSAVVATHPLAYYRLDTVAGPAKVGSTRYESKGGVTTTDGAPIGVGGNMALQMDGKTGYVVTTQMGGVGVAASIMAWVKLGGLPSEAGRILYVAGESEYGNDLDLQFEGDNALRFFTAAGGSLAYKPSKDTLVNQWHMIVATLDTPTQTRVIYWDGVKVATDKGGGEAGKKNALSIGESTIFRGRFFKGAIDEVGLWNRALKEDEVKTIYGATGGGGTPGTAHEQNGRGAGGGAAGSGGGGTGSGGGLFPTTAKVEVGDEKGPIPLKRPETTAIMFLTAIMQIEGDCQDKGGACGLSEVLGRLKYDPRTDPNYAYTVTASGMAWEAHATAKKPGLIGFCFFSRMQHTSTATYNRSGTAGPIDPELGNRSIDGDTFMKQ